MLEPAQESKGEAGTAKRRFAAAGPLAAWWTRLTLQKQVAVLIVIFVLVVEGLSLGAAFVQIRRGHEAAIEHAALAFVHETLEIVTAADKTEKLAVAKLLSFGGRSLKVGKLVSAASWKGAESHVEIADDLRDLLREEGFSVEEVIDADWQVHPERPFRKWLDEIAAAPVLPRTALPAMRGQKPRALVLIAVKLESDPYWYNYFFLLPATDFKVMFRNAITDAVVALLLTMPLIWLIGHVMRPFGTLARNAERLGRGETVASIDPGGSADVRSTVDAFNRMGNRIALSRDYQAVMLRSLAHDLKGPLAGAARITESLSDQSSGSRISKYLKAVQESIEAITGFARATRRDGDAALVDLPSLIEALVDEQLDAGVEASLQVQAPVTLQGRRNALSRALQNILENAGKYGGSFAVNLTRDERNAIIQVDDNGPGIAADKQELVFRPFERLATDAPGSGLGLSIAKAIVVDHGGTIELQNRAPRGLRVTVTLPLDPKHL